MLSSKLPTEVELIYEVMPCNAMLCTQEPIQIKHPCTYFRKWGSYHSYDYLMDGPPPTENIIQRSVYMGKAQILPEVLSGCRKAPIMAVGINPNLPAFWQNKRNSIYPLFDDYKQYAHYFRYRAVAKLEIPKKNYTAFGGGASDKPFSDFELNVPPDDSGKKIIPVELQKQQMYLTYQDLLDSFASKMGWNNHSLSVGEDLSYGNMVACSSAKWTTSHDAQNPDLPPMTIKERDGIVKECFFDRKHFLKQLFQSLPKVILIFSQNTANAFISSLSKNFIAGHPKVGEPIEKLLKRTHRIDLGKTPSGSKLICRVIFCPHPTGDPADFKPVKQTIIDCLAEEGSAGNLTLNKNNGHLNRTAGSCVFCPMLEIGKCDYEDEIRPLTAPHTAVHAQFNAFAVQEKQHQQSLIENSLKLNFHPEDWNG